jgi:hypothetical protein
VSPAKFGTGPAAAALDELCCGVGLTCPELGELGDLGEVLIEERVDPDVAGRPEADLDGCLVDDDATACDEGAALHAATSAAMSAIPASGHRLVRRGEPTRTLDAARQANSR